MPEDCLEPESGKASKKIAAPWVRRMIAVAAVVALVVFIPITAKAFGLEDIWNVIAYWAKETFSFVSGEDTEISEPDPTHKEEYSSLQELLADYNRDTSVLPTWIPEGFILEKVEQDITPVQEIYRALYLYNNHSFEIRIIFYTAKENQSYEISEDPLEIYSCTARDYYIFENMDNLQAIWYTDTYEANISGNLSLDVIKAMIDSIEEG